MKIVLVANLMQVLLKINLIHSPVLLSTELSLCCAFLSWQAFLFCFVFVSNARR